MVADQTTTERFIADTSAYVRRVEEAARQADAFGRSNSETALAARRMGLAATEAADRAGRAMRDAADAAQRLGREEISADEAARAAARGARELERADIAQAAAARAAAKATNDLADQQRKAAEAAVVAAGLERLAQLRAQGSIREHNTLLTHLRRNYSGVGTDVREMSSLASRAFGLVARAGTNAVEGITSLASGLAQSWPAILAMVAAGIALLPIAAIAAGGAITFVLGGALAAVGIMAVAKSAEVKASFAEFANSAKAQAQKWAEPWKPAIQGIFRMADQVVHQLGPTMTAVFAQMAPKVQQFTGQLGAGLVALGPAFTIVGDAFGKILDQLGPQLPLMMELIGNGIASVAQVAGDHAAEFAQVGVIIGYAIDGLGQMIGWLIKAGSETQKFFGIFDAIAGKPKATATALEVMTAASGANSVQTQLMGGALNTAASAMELASLNADQLKNKLDALTGKELSARDAAANYATAIFAMNKSLHDNGTAHGFATVKGVANEKALTALAKAANANAEAMAADHRSASDVAKAMTEARARIIAAAEKMHYSKGEAEALAIKLLGVAGAAGKVPAKTLTSVKGDITDLEHKLSAAKANLKTVPPWRKAEVRGDIADLQRKIASAKAWLASLQNKTVTVTYYARNQGQAIANSKNLGYAKGGYVGEGYAVGGMVKRYADAGLVTGPGTGTSDSIPAMLSNGEFVVTAAATKANRALLETINKTHNSAGQTTVKPRSSGISKASDSYQTATGGGAAKYWEWIAPHHGLQSYGSQSGREQVVNHNYYVSGSVVTENELTSMLQAKILQQGKALTLPAGR